MELGKAKIPRIIFRKRLSQNTSASTDYRLDVERIPGFNVMNDAAVRLSDKDIRREFAVEVVGVIDNRLEELNIKRVL